jgi:hypothetical protein
MDIQAVKHQEFRIKKDYTETLKRQRSIWEGYWELAKR